MYEALFVVLFILGGVLGISIGSEGKYTKQELLKHNLAYYSTTSGQFILKDLKGE